MKKFLKKAEGFTLVELIVVIAILGILAGVAVPAYTGYINRANQAADITTLDAVKTAAMAAYADNGEVTSMTVTEDAVTVNGSVTLTADADFLAFMNQTEFSIDLTSCTQATWPKSATDSSWNLVSGD